MTMFGFSLRGEGSPTLELDLYDEIGGSISEEGVTARAIRQKLLASSGAKTIGLNINSRGGDVIDGMAIYAMLKEHPARVEARVHGLAGSIASVILMSADDISVSSGAMVMIHNASGGLFGDAKAMRARADLLDKINAQMADIYAARTKRSRDDVVAMMDTETWMTADEAVSAGFADRVSRVPANVTALAGLDLRGLSAPPWFSQMVAHARSTPTATPDLSASPLGELKR